MIANQVRVSQRTIDRYSLGMKIKMARRHRFLTQVELAKRMGICQSHISLYENGQKYPWPQTLEKIAKALEMDIEYFKKP